MALNSLICADVPLRNCSLILVVGSNIILFRGEFISSMRIQESSLVQSVWCAGNADTESAAETALPQQ